MGVAERKIREKEELRESILKAAMELFIENGFEKTSIRNIADRIEYSPGIIYHYFQDKNEIFYALHSLGFMEMRKRMEILAAIADPMSRLRAMGKIYIQFAMDNADMYDLMFIKEAPMEHLENKSGECWVEGNNTFALLRETVRQCMANGHFEGHALEPVSYLVWAAVHGIVSLYIRKRVTVLEMSEVDQIVDNSFQSLLKILDRV